VFLLDLVYRSDGNFFLKTYDLPTIFCVPPGPPRSIYHVLGHIWSLSLEYFDFLSCFSLKEESILICDYDDVENYF
jgi:hypothetical protein